MGKKEPKTKREEGQRFAEILDQARMLIAEENFLNWQVTFPGIWSDWEEDDLTGGFHAVIGNPPWDRMKLQQVEWFAERRPEIAMAARAADRKKMIDALEKADDPLAQDYAKASERAEAGTRMARKGGDYPLLSGGDVNLYSLFVERAMTVVKQEGLIGLLVPSGIASDKTAAKFFKGVATEGRLKALYDFENRRTRYDLKPFFEDVDSRFKFSAFVASPTPTEEAARCAFFLQAVSELTNPEVCFSLSAEDFARVSPNTGTAPIFRSKRDADLTTVIYGNAVPLVDRSSGTEVKTWPVKYSTMFHMTNDSGLFSTRKELDDQEGAYPLGGNTFGSASGNWLPLYVGRMIHQFDHRAASVEVNEANLHNAALSGAVTEEQKADPNFVPTPQYWVPESEVDLPSGIEWTIAFRDIARATDARTMIATLAPKAGFGNKAPLLLPEDVDTYRSCADLIVAALLHGSSGARNAPYPRRNSGGAFETWLAKPGHSVENLHANPGFRFLVFEVARLQPGPNNRLPAAHESFTPAALIVASGFLPGHPPAGCDLGDMAVSCRQIVGRIGAHNRVFGRWDRHLDHRSEPSGK